MTLLHALIIPVAIFLSAFFLFTSELLIGQMLLPFYGGSGHVWATSLVFFTTVLTLGYYGAYLVSVHLKDKRQMIFFVLLLLLGFLAIPFRLRSVAAENPYWGVLISLSLSIGLPFLLLAMASPLLQLWVASSSLAGKENPYFLYAVSNAGSLSALLLNPFFLAPFFSLKAQGWLISGVYASFLALMLALLPLKIQTPAKMSSRGAAGGSSTIPLSQKLSWMLFSAAGTALMIAVTHMSSMDIGQVPLLWVIPLAIYLVTLILNFGRHPWCPRYLLHVGFALFVGVKIWAMMVAPARNVFLGILPHYILLFVGNMIAHRRLYLSRPAEERDQLTSYYLFISLGGALGMFLIAFFIPWALRHSPFYSFELILALLILFAGMVWQMRQEMTKGKILALVAVLTLVVGLGWALTRQSAALLSLRNFYGQYAVYDQEGIRFFLNGTTLHGKQFLDPRTRHIPLLYYRTDSPIGEVFSLLPTPGRVGSVGLGIGSLLSYSKAQQTWDLYELDPDVVMIAQRYFTHLSDSPAQKNIIVGDGRLKLSKAPEHSYDLLILDAFSSDAVPTHLLTLEALSLYQQKIKPGGVIAFHLSNAYLNLVRLLSFSAQEKGTPFAFSNGRSGHPPLGEEHSQWLVMSTNQDLIKRLTTEKGWIDHTKGRKLRTWRDDYASILPIFLDF